MCICWTIKSLILLMDGATMKTATFYIAVSCLGCVVVSCLVCTVVVVLSVLLSSYV
jgi:hypothetical protein